MKQKSNKSSRQVEGGSAPSCQEALTAVIADGSRDELVGIQRAGCVRWCLWLTGLSAPRPPLDSVKSHKSTE